MPDDGKPSMTSPQKHKNTDKPGSNFSRAQEAIDIDFA